MLTTRAPVMYTRSRLSGGDVRGSNRRHIMRRYGLPVLFAMFALLAVSSAYADPDLPIITVNPADAMNGPLVAPGAPQPVPASILNITIHDAANQPMPGLLVEVSFAAGIDVCPGAMLQGTTDQN